MLISKWPRHCGLVATRRPCLVCSHVLQYGPAQMRPLATAKRRKPRAAPKAILDTLHRKRKALGDPGRAAAIKEWADHMIGEDERMGILQGNKSLVVKMTSHMVAFYEGIIREGFVASNVQWLMDTIQMSPDEVYQCSVFLRHLGNVEQVAHGRQLVRLLSRLGHPESVIQVCASFLRQDIARRGVLESYEARQAQSSLQRVLSRDENVRAEVLSAKLAERNGTPDVAKEMYASAMRKIVSGKGGDLHLDIRDELSSPWMELAMLQLHDGEYDAATRTYQVGIEQSDPMAHYMLGRLQRQSAGYSSDWLINTYKAAASGHCQAAFDLGEYYAKKEGHPEPEPKPPLPARWKEWFSRSSSPGESLPHKQSLATRLRQFMSSGLLKPLVDVKEASGSMGDFDAAIRKDPQHRYRLAAEWFRAAALKTHVPSYLELARLHLRGPKPDKFKAEMYIATVFNARAYIQRCRERVKDELTFRRAGKPWTDHPEVLQTYEKDLDVLAAEAAKLATRHGMKLNTPRIFNVHDFLKTDTSRMAMLQSEIGPMVLGSLNLQGVVEGWMMARRRAVEGWEDLKKKNLP